MLHTAPSKRKAALPDAQELKCKNGCGYYGNPEWSGYCSKCHRDLNQKKKPERSSKSSKKIQRSYSDAQESALSLGFSKFEEKKKQQVEKRSKTIKSIMKRGHTVKESSNNISPSRDLFAVNDIFLMGQDLQLKESVLKDVVREMQRQLDIMGKYFERSIDEQSEDMQNFYNYMFKKCETHPDYLEMSTEQVDLLMDKIEMQLMNSMLHRVVSQQISSEYEEKDLALQNRIRSLNWISSQHLGLNITENSPDVRDLMDKAIADVIQMDSMIAPQQKIKCIVNCSESIFNIIKLCGVTASADEFLPAMVYIVLKANPPLLQSNIKYITSYSIPARLRSGEGAYYFTNLCCAVAFIEDLTAESLNLSEEEFQRYMSGEVPLAHIEQNASDCEGLRVMTQNLITLNEIQEKNNKVLNDMLNLRDDMVKFQETLLKCKPLSPLVINPTPYTVPANTDMSLIPEVLRNRIAKAPTEDILVDIDSKSEDAVIDDTLPSNPSPDLEHTKDPYMCSLSEITESSTTSSFPTLQVLLPTRGNSVCENSNPFSSFEGSTPQTSHPINISQAVVNIQDLEYPTELFPEMKSDSSVEFGPFEGCDPLEPDESSTMDPLSPEVGFMEDNLNLPPPLQPVVVQSVNKELGDTKM